MSTATVAICTHNRADLVGRAVTAALDETRATEADVLVVDNASTDATPAVLAAMAHEHGRGKRLRLITEPRLGLSHARNRALTETQAPVVAFLDDDAVPRAGWLRALLAPYSEPAVASVGGRVHPAFSGPVPTWLATSLLPALSCFDAGDHSHRLRYGCEDYPVGANISFRTAAARTAGGFSTAIGLRGRQQRQHEETDLCYRLEASGGEIRYAPDAVVDHWIAPERLTPRWFLARYGQGGQSAATFILRNRGVARALWRLWWLYRHDLVRRPYFPTEPIDADRLVAECRRREARGYLSGLARHMIRTGEH